MVFLLEYLHLLAMVMVNNLEIKLVYLSEMELAF